MQAYNILLEEQITGTGLGDGCHAQTIEKNGLIIKALVSVGENFIGVNCNGTDLSLDEDLISWKLEVFTGKQYVASDSRQLTVKQLRGCGSLGKFYSPSLKQQLIENHQIKFWVQVKTTKDIYNQTTLSTEPAETPYPYAKDKEE